MSYTIDQEVIDKRNLWKTLKRLKDTLNMVELITDEPTSNKKMQGKLIKLISTDATIAQKKPSVQQQWNGWWRKPWPQMP